MSDRKGLRFSASASLLAVLFVILFYSGANAQVLVEKSLTFPAIDLTWTTTAPQEVIFDVQNPGYVTVKIWVEPYRACGKAAYQSVTFQWGQEAIPFEKTLVSKSIQNGQRATYQEGVPIYHETIYQAYRSFLGIHAWLHPARTLSPSSGWTQYRQVVRLVVEYSAKPPSGVEAGSGGGGPDVGVTWAASPYSQGIGSTGGGSTGGTSTAMTLRAESRKAKAGDAITLPIWLDQASGVAAMNFTVNYDASVVRANRVVKGSFFKGGTLVESNPGETGVVRLGFADRADLNGTGPVAQISFQVVGKAGDRSPIRLQVSTAAGAAGTKPIVKTVDGEIQVLGSGGGTPGDSNNNGTLDAGDALDALKMSVRLIAEKMSCDIDGDKQVTSTDARLILEKVVGR